MPNYCHNHLTIKGPEAEIARFIEKSNGDGNFDFQSLFPCPEELFNLTNSPSEKEKESLVGKYGFHSPVEWQMENYSIKWGCIDCGEWIHDGDTASIEFFTPWNQPTKFFMKVSQDFRELEFVNCFSEPGWGLAGTEIFSNGSVC